MKIALVKRKGVYKILYGKRILGTTTTKKAGLIEARTYRKHMSMARRRIAIIKKKRKR